MKSIEYFQNKIFCGDSLKLMKKIPCNSVDLILTDPPYNIGDNNKLTKVGNKFQTNKESWGEWDSMDEKEYFKWIENNIIEFFRILKNSGSLVCFFDKFNITYLKDFGLKVGFYPINFYALVKNNPVPNLRRNGFTSGFELGVIFNKNKKEKKWNFQRQNQMQNYFIYNIGKKYTSHPTEKPLAAFERLIQIFTNQNDIVLDPFLGSGTTAVAAKILKRNYIGIEKNKKYVSMAEHRIKAIQDSLF